MRRSQSILFVGCCLVVAATTPLKIGVILGRDNRTSDTSDQEQWAVEQARLDVAAELEKSGGRYSIQLSTVFTGEDSESPEALLAVRQFLKTSSANGVGLVVGAYLSESSLLAVRGSLEPLGLTLLAPASGLPVLPPPRDRVLRFWPNDKWQAEVLASVVRRNGTRAAVVLSRDDLTGRALATRLASALPTVLLPHGGPLFYNATLGAASYGPLLDHLRKVIEKTPHDKVAFVCNCGPDEISSIVDAMDSNRWPIAKTRLILTDRSTPTRSVVATPSRRAFAAALNTSGVLSHLPTVNNPSYSRLAKRWAAIGQTGSLFASALSAYDAVRIAALTAVIAGGGATVNATGLTAAVAGVADQHWGASGMMALDESGDLYRAVYDVYEVDGEKGWRVVGAPVDAKAMPVVASDRLNR